MIFGKTKLELKVGAFVFIGLVILTILVLLIGDFKTWNAGYNVKLKFGFINGVKVGAPIRFAGFDVGEVKEIKIMFNPTDQKTDVILMGWLKNEVKIPVDSSVWVNTLGLLGEKYIEIMPGAKYGELIKQDDIIVGVDPIPMQEVTVLAKKIASDIDESIVKLNNKEGTVGKLLYDDTIYKELEALVFDLKKHPWKLFWKSKSK